MIIFNGVPIETIVPVMIEDVRVSPIQRNVTARQRPTQPGADFVRVNDGTRTVAITFGLLTQDTDMRQDQLLQIAAWARSDQPQRLDLPYHDGAHLMALATALPEPSMRQWWESKLRITFTCYDPYWRSNAERSAACGTPFVVLGDAPPLMQIRNTYTDAATDQAWARDGETMTFSSVPAGDLVIDLNAQTAAVGASSIMSAYAFGSTFLLPKTGRQTITGAGTVYWRERWE